MSRLVVACHKVAIPNPAGELQFSGRYTASGDPILRKQISYARPGTFFEFPEGEELVRLIDGGAVRLPDEFELAAYEQTRGVEA